MDFPNLPDVNLITMRISKIDYMVSIENAFTFVKVIAIFKNAEVYQIFIMLFVCAR